MGGLFGGSSGKRKYSPREAAEIFIESISSEITGGWNERYRQTFLAATGTAAIMGEIKGDFVARGLEEPPDLVMGAPEMLTATVAIEFQALPNLLPARQAADVRTAVFGVLMDLGPWAAMVKEYDEVWKDPGRNRPWDAVAGHLISRVHADLREYGIENLKERLIDSGAVVVMGGECLLSPLRTMQLGAALFGLGWWKFFIEKNIIA